MIIKYLLNLKYYLIIMILFLFIVGLHFSRLFKRLGIKDFTYHNLRHCFSTFQSDTGSDAFTTQALLGHASLIQTAKYTYKQSEAKRKAIETITDYVFNKSNNIFIQVL